MHGNSPRIESAQRGVHPRLASRLDTAGDYRRPIDTRTLRAMERLQGLLPAFDGLVLDHGCGFGESTRTLARARPDLLVLGVDRSAHRLGAAGVGGDGWWRAANCVLLQADCIDVWQHGADRGWRAHAQYFLYPNPWPKPRQLRKRWHAHPAFPAALALGGRIELRTNWRPYLDEFAAALARLTGRAPVTAPFEPAPAMTRFERKFRDSGHALYRAVLAPDTHGRNSASA